ncbi:hypothetical protein ACU686_03465 [Yinghuangia aomiensis]
MSTATPDPTTTATARSAGEAAAVRHDTFVVRTGGGRPHGRGVRRFRRPHRSGAGGFKLPGREVAYRHDFAVAGGESASSVFHDRRRGARTPRVRGPLPGHRPGHARRVRVHLQRERSRCAGGSLVTVELDPTDQGHPVRWTEQAAFTTPSARPEHDLPHLRGAIRLRLNGLAPALTCRLRHPVAVRTRRSAGAADGVGRPLLRRSSAHRDEGFSTMTRLR